MIRSIAAACLLALMAGFGAVTPARAAGPITVNRIFGFVTSTVPDAFKYPIVPPLTDHSAGIVELWSGIYFRQAAPAANISHIGTMTAQSYGNSNNQINSGTLSINYDANANTTTINIQNSTYQAKMIVPVNIQPVFSDNDTKVAANNLKSGDIISGSSGGSSYSGRIVTYSSPLYGQESFLAYQLLDSAGKTLLYARANNGGMPDIRIPGGVNVGNAVNVYGGLPANSTLPPNCGSGTFTQVKNGQTLTGTFQPVSFAVFSIDASQDAYWSTH